MQIVGKSRVLKRSLSLSLAESFSEMSTILRTGVLQFLLHFCIKKIVCLKSFSLDCLKLIDLEFHFKF